MPVDDFQNITPRSNHEFDLKRTQNLDRYPFYERAIQLPNWHTLARSGDFYFTRRLGSAPHAPAPPAEARRAPGGAGRGPATIPRVIVEPRESALLTLLFGSGPMSRSELHARTGFRPNTVGALAAGLIDRGLIRESAAETAGPGRPRVPLEIDPENRYVLGISLLPGKIGFAALNLYGQSIEPLQNHPCPDHGEIVIQAAELAAAHRHRHPLALGLSVSGCVDAETQRLLLSAAAPSHRGISLTPLFDALPGCPIIVENDMHALAARWALGPAGHATSHEDVLLIHLRDGALGAALLINGQPNRGCVIGGNELGHFRFFVETEPCYCGHTGCLERIFSTDFLRRHGASAPLTLGQAIAGFQGEAGPVGDILRYLATGLTNAINFIRPRRVVFISEFSPHRAFHDHLEESIRHGLLSALTHRVLIEHWDHPTSAWAESAGFLALASIYRPSWARRLHENMLPRPLARR